MRFSRPKGFIALSCLSFLLFGCGKYSTTTLSLDLEQYQTQSVAWGQCPADYFLDEQARDQNFQSQNARCGFVKVPAQYIDGTALPDFKIAMMRQSATGSNKLGTLFINPGGPGGSGIEQLQWLNFPEQIRESYDIVGFDPRGVNHSAPVSGQQIKCSTQSDYETYWVDESTPANDKEYLATVDTLDAYYKKCAEDNPTWWTLSTKNVVDDLEIMRQVLTGNQPLNFLGSSYGTTIAAEYITRFPKHVGRIALDSPTTNEPAKPETEIAEAKAFEESVLRLVQGYADARGMTVEAVKKLMLKVRADGDNDLLIGFAGMKVIDAANEIHQSTEYMFTHGIAALTYYETNDAQKYFNQALDEVSGPNKWNGNFESFALELDGYDTTTLGGSRYAPNNIKRDNSFEIMDIVRSMDLDFPNDLSSAENEKLDNQIRKVSPFWTKLTSDSSNYEYKGDRLGIDWTEMAKNDDEIPDPPTAMPERTNSSGKAVLVVGSRYEATTPYVFAVKTAKDLKSPLVTFNGTGHAPLAGFDNACLNDIFIDYFINDNLPSGSVTCDK